MTTSDSISTKSHAQHQSKPDSTDKLLLATPVRSQWQIDLQRLCRHRAAMAGLILILTIAVMAFLAPWLSPYPYRAQHLDFIRAAPSTQFPLGTDSLGRDLLSRLLYGARIALFVALVVVAIEVVIGVPLGMVAGYFRGRLDVAVNTLADMFWAFPPLVLAMGVVAAVGPGLFNTMVVIALVSWVPFTRVTRAKVLSLRQRDFVQASIAIGGTHGWVLRRHILPNILITNLVLVTLTLPTVLLTVAALSFLGFGVQPPTPEWGAMLSEGRPYLQEAPWISTFPGLAILLTVIGFNLLGDGLRDVLDPKQTW
jgi:peptide/nickel transport system permease protein